MKNDFVIMSMSYATNCLIVQGGYSSAFRSYTCPMEERSDGYYFRFRNEWHKVSDYVDSNTMVFH